MVSNAKKRGRAAKAHARVKQERGNILFGIHDGVER